ncbi:MAG: hypothetical protein Q9162_002996 [Coniocarpon cinnabarinum]
MKKFGDLVKHVWGEGGKNFNIASKNVATIGAVIAAGISIEHFISAVQKEEKGQPLDKAEEAALEAVKDGKFKQTIGTIEEAAAKLGNKDLGERIEQAEKKLEDQQEKGEKK